MLEALEANVLELYCILRASAMGVFQAEPVWPVCRNAEAYTRPLCRSTMAAKAASDPCSTYARNNPASLFIAASYSITDAKRKTGQRIVGSSMISSDSGLHLLLMARGASRSPLKRQWADVPAS